MYFTHKSFVRAISLVFMLSILSACGGAAGSNGSQSNAGTTKTTAIEKIEAFARDANNPAPTVQDYIDAGVTGVTSENLAQLNSVVSDLSPADVDTTEELTTLTEQLAVNIIPTANAGGNKTVQINHSVTLNGSGTDTDGDIVSYSWEKDGVVISTTASFNYTPTLAGTDTLTLTLTDDDGDTASDSIVIIVNEAPTPSNPNPSTPPTTNQPPTVNAGTNLSTQVNHTITISGTGSDSDGTVTFVWKKGDTILATNASFNYAPTVIGTDTLTLYVTDNNGTTVSDSMSVIVTAVPTPPTPENIAPTANAGGNKTVQVNQSITITGIGTDSDGTVTYRWQNGAAVIATSASFSYTPTVVGTITLDLTVTDDDGAVATSSMTLNITAGPDTTRPVITLLGDSQLNITQGGIYTEAGATAQDNIDADISTNIQIGGDTVNPNSPVSTQFTITYNVSDAAGNPATQVTRTVTIIEVADTIDPVITLIGGTTIEVIQGATYVEASATATDNKDGNISANIVMAGDTVNTQAAPGNTFTITYNVTDAAGNSAIEVIRTVSIIANPNSTHVIPALTAAEITNYLSLINTARSVDRDCGGNVGFKFAVPALAWSDKLYRAAYEHSQDMAVSHVFSHDGSGTESDWTGVTLGADEKSTVVNRLATYAYTWSAYGENIAVGYQTPEAVMQGWLNSSGHCANIMSANFNQAGMARVGNYWTQDFGYSN